MLSATASSFSSPANSARAGPNGTLQVGPYYNKPTQEGLYRHFKAAAECDIPVIVYNIPGRSVVNMSVETMARLAELPNIVGLKDATGDLTRPSLQRWKIGPEFIPLSGEDGPALAFNAHCAARCISVAANVAPPGGG